MLVLWLTHPTASGLPEFSAYQHSDGSTVTICRGERIIKRVRRITANGINRKLGVSKAQAKAMYCGAMLGWHRPEADPANYDEDGEFIRK